jgi:hypothetical protein
MTALKILWGGNMTIQTLEHVIIVLEASFREGADEDIPEGARYIKLSDTVTKRMVEALRVCERNHENQIQDILSRK